MLLAQGDGAGLPTSTSTSGLSVAAGAVSADSRSRLPLALSSALLPAVIWHRRGIAPRPFSWPLDRRGGHLAVEYIGGEIFVRLFFRVDNNNFY